jgi:hypothetical protein
VIAEERGDLGAVGGAQQRLVAAVLRQPNGADDPPGDLMSQDDPGKAKADDPGEGAERQRDERDQGDPLDSSLSRSGSATLERS